MMGVCDGCVGVYVYARKGLHIFFDSQLSEACQPIKSPARQRPQLVVVKITMGIQTMISNSCKEGGMLGLPWK